ncbi:MAG: ATP-binding protein [Chitinispirillaceae bacterium]|nr:ATP-binding protein [Chitinispirillaceae bacterium]
MKEIVIISGKGGTGKTSIAASFAAIAKGKAVLADCDVDAADLHLILKPEIRRRTEFRSGHKAIIRKNRCTGCGKCAQVCRFDALHDGTTWDAYPEVRYSIDPVACEGCGVCVRVCPADAIDFPEETCGEWYISDTRFGAMVHAKLGIAAENSGKLVTLVRSEAKRIAQEEGADYLLIDGSPGIGCPVIASLTAADFALIVTEPTVSGDHDLRRIAGLAKQLGVPAMVCVNKWDINPAATREIKALAQGHGISFAGLVRYDRAVTEAQRAEKAVVEYCAEGVAMDIQGVWTAVLDAINT